MEFAHPVNEPMLASYVVREIERWESITMWWCVLRLYANQEDVAGE